MFNSKKTMIAGLVALAAGATLTGCNETAPKASAAEASDVSRIAYLDPAIHGDKFGTREEKRNNPDHPYSSEVAGETGSDQCRTPSGFTEVWDSAEKHMNSAHSTFGYGQPISESAITGDWRLSALGDGTNLPPEGVGDTIARGEELFQMYCAACHGEFAEGNGHYLPLAGGPTDMTDNGGPMPVKTISNYWPYAISWFDYARRAMPFFQPNHPDIGDAGYLAITGWVAYTGGYTTIDGQEIDEDTFFDSKLLVKLNEEVKAKNNVNYFCDPRPEVHNVRCGLNGDKCPDAVVGNGKGEIKFKEALINPVTGLPQYNTNQRP